MPRKAIWHLGLFVAIVLTLNWLVRRIVPDGDAGAVQFVIREALYFLVLLLASWVMARIEGRSIADYGLPWRGMFRTQFWQGAGLGFAGGTALVSAMRVAGVFTFGTLALHGWDILLWAIAWALVFLLVGLFEEFQSRGYALVALRDAFGFWPGALLTSIFFAYTHYSNTGEDWIGLFNAGTFGLLQCFILRRTGTLWMPIGVHAAFDWSETYFYGVADSGQTLPGHLLGSATSGVSWLSGGKVGPEGSVLATVLILVMWLVCAARLNVKQCPESMGKSP